MFAFVLSSAPFPQSTVIDSIEHDLESPGLFFDGERMDEAENQHLSNGDLFELKDLASQSLSLVIREYRNDELFHTHQVRLDLEDNPTDYDSE